MIFTNANTKMTCTTKGCRFNVPAKIFRRITFDYLCPVCKKVHLSEFKTEDRKF